MKAGLQSAGRGILLEIGAASRNCTGVTGLAYRNPAAERWPRLKNESPGRAAEVSGRPVGECDVYKEQTPLPLLPEPHPLDFTADVSVFEFGTPDKKPVWI